MGTGLYHRGAIRYASGVPVESLVTRCGNCGAPIQRASGVDSVRCTYCEQVTWLAPVRHATAATPVVAPPSVESDPLARIARGPLGASVGDGARLGTGAIPRNDPALLERALWPVGAEASSTFGGPWSPSTLIGPPKVYPRSGDLAGAWAPGPSQSPVEWIEVRFAGDVPVTAIRVFETNQAGSTYAVVDVSQGAELLFARGVEPWSGAAVLEVKLPAPRVIRALRVFVVNRGWTEIDAVCLLAAAPLPPAMRTAMPKVSSGCALMALVAVGVIAGLVAVGALASRGSGGPRAVPTVSAALSTTQLAYGSVEPSALATRGVIWSDTTGDFSSEYASDRNAASAAAGPPDVFPRSGDIAGAWAPQRTDGGIEWVTVRFTRPVRASSVLWVETFNPGAVMRVDDVSDGGDAVALWQGDTGRPGTPTAVGEVRLASPRMIRAVRLLLDTRRVPGWNEVDAIGLVPAGP